MFGIAIRRLWIFQVSEHLNVHILFVMYTHFPFPFQEEHLKLFFVILPNHQEDYFKSSPTSEKRANKECRFLWLVNELSCMLQQLQYINDLLKNVMLIFPQYCLGLGLMEMSRNQLYSDAFKKFGQYFIHLYTNLFYIY